MKGKLRLRRPSLRLYDATGLSLQTQRGLNMAILAVTFSMVMTTITTGAAWTGFQRMLGADAQLLGVISAIPVAASTLQILAAYMLERWRARRALFLGFGIVSRLLWVVIGLIPYFTPMAQPQMRLVLLMVFLALSAGSGAFINVAFYSLIGDLVPLRIRGRYFSSRQAVSLLSGILAGLLVSWLLDATEGFTGYTIALVVAGVFGTADICCFFFVAWPPMQPQGNARPGLGRMLRTVLRDRGYMRIVGYFTLWFFAVNLCGPFTNVFFLEEVRMTYTQITLLNQIVPNMATVLVIGWWGRQMDRYGNQPIVQTAGLYCMLLPLSYLLIGPHSFWILPFANVLSGICWPASDLGQQNMYLAKAPAQNRSMYVAVFFASTQLLGTALSNYVGGYLMDGPLATLAASGFAGFSRYDYIFLLSSLLRIMCVVALLPRLRQEEDTPAPKMCREIVGEFHMRAIALWRELRATRLRRKYYRRYRKKEEDT